MPAFLWHVAVTPGDSLEAPIAEGSEAAAYVIAGEGLFEGETAARSGRLVVWEGTRGSVRVTNAGRAPLELMMLGGAPAEGPLVFHGPFVMNSMDQVRAAEIAYRTGRMGALAED
jgi:redox-sensitive bicupin YhaK (pirin superfamily)